MCWAGTVFVSSFVLTLVSEAASEVKAPSEAVEATEVAPEVKEASEAVTQEESTDTPNTKPEM